MAIKKVTATCNGVTTELPYDPSKGKFYLDGFTAPSKSSYDQPDHVYVITIKAEDEAGNITTENTSIRVLETVKPICEFIEPLEGALLRTTRPQISWQCTDDDSGVNHETISITIDGNTMTTGIVKTEITGGYLCAYTPSDDLTQGLHTVNVECADNDGNTAEQADVSFICDTVNPILEISTPPDGKITNMTMCTVSGSATDATTAPCSVEIKLNNDDFEQISVSETGAFSKALALAEGDNTIIVTARDRAGNETIKTVTITLDTIAPVIHMISIDPDPAIADSTFTITVDVSDD